MLRAGAEVHVTSRFPRDAARRYAEEADAPSWSDRLHVHGVDFRDLRQLLRTLHAMRSGPSFDIVVNNAAQTVWHPPAYYEALYSGEQPETTGEALLPLLSGSLASLDVQRADSWVQSLGEIAPVEMIEVHVVNAIAPFLVCNMLRENLERSSFTDRYIVNVSAVEGQFAREEKPIRHPHTNMAKAALNMLTRTSAPELLTRGIYMVSIDPGWMSSEGKNIRPDVEPALEAEDCAARVLHPIAAGLAGAPLHGVLLKDFVEVPW
jgi:NAD(P)-dependent dehydrogenase (short-subunit alcohol dehydrogenase family)